MNNPKLRTQYSGTTLIIHLPSELDENTCPQVTTNLKSRLTHRCPTTLIFDFTATIFMDSAAIGMLLARYKELTLLGTTIYLTGERDRIQKILRMSGIYTIIKHIDMPQAPQIHC